MSLLRAGGPVFVALLWVVLEALCPPLGPIARHPRSVRAQTVSGDGIAAIVGGRTPGDGATVILHSDVELRARLSLVARDRRALDAMLPSGLLATVLEEIVGEVLIAREAERVELSRVTEEDRSREWRRLEALAGGGERLPALLASLGASRAELQAIVDRRARVSAFLRANLGSAAEVSDAEVEELYRSGAHPFPGQPLEAVAEALRVMILRQRIEDAVASWIDHLRTRTTVRVFADYAR